VEIHTKLQDLILELIKAKREYFRLAFDQELRFELGRPCTPEQVAKLSAVLGRPLPPSYRAFLELHNGWKGFDGPADILAVEDYDRTWVKNRLKTLSSLLTEYGDKNPFKVGAIPIVLGEDEPAFTVLDPNEVRKNGEMTFITYNLTQEQDRFKDFIAFLEDDLSVCLELIKEETEGVEDEDLPEGED